MGNREIFNNLAERYVNKWNTSTEEKENLKKIIKFLKLKKGDIVLEPGCGKGDFSVFILEKIGEKGFLYAVDMSENMLNYAKEKLLKFKNVKLINCDVKNTKIKEKSIDKIICFNCFPHFYPKEKYIRKFYNLLKKNGLLIIAHSLSREKINNLHKKWGFNMREHFLPGIPQMNKMLKRNKFTIEKKINKKFYFIRAKKV